MGRRGPTGLPVLDIQDEASWPDPVRSVLADAMPVLTAYEHERARVDRLCETDVIARIRPPSNPHAGAWNAVLDTVASLIQDIRLLGYHCTRLAPDEREAVLRDGLSPLSTGLLAMRIERRVAAGDIRPDLACRLLVEDEAGESHRAGTLWFIAPRSVLEWESSVVGLLLPKTWGLGWWGGEALYGAHEDDPEIGPLHLFARRLDHVIGRPCSRGVSSVSSRSRSPTSG